MERVKKGQHVELRSDKYIYMTEEELNDLIKPPWHRISFWFMVTGSALIGFALPQILIRL